MNTDQASHVLPYDFGVDPVIVNTSRPSSDRIKLAHRLRKPILEQWLVWGHEVYEEREPLSEEQARESFPKSDEDDPTTSAYSQRFDEYDASRRLYEAIALEVTQLKRGTDEAWESVETRLVTPELIESGTLSPAVVIGGLYKSYCVIKEKPTEGEDGIYVSQEIGASETPPTVLHVLSHDLEKERELFQNNVLREWRTNANINVWRYSLDLRVIDDLYNKALLRVGNATVNGEVFSDNQRASFLKSINPVHKLKVLEAAFQSELIRFKYDWI